MYEHTRSLMDSNHTKAAPRTGYTGGPQREGNPDECFYCHQKGHRKPDCPHFIKHQQELNGFKNTKPAMGANAVSPTVCVMTRAQQAAVEKGKENSQNNDSDDEEDLSSGSSEEQEDHQPRDDNSDEEKDDVCEQEEHTNDNKENEERPIGANSNEWKADRIFHQEVSKTIKELQEDDGGALPTPEEFVPWYPEEEEAEKPMERSPEKGGTPTTTQPKVDKILENVMNHTKANISIGQLLEIAPYCKKQIMAALTNDEKLEESAQTYQVTAKTFDEKMPMISIIVKTDEYRTC